MPSLPQTQLYHVEPSHHMAQASQWFREEQSCMLPDPALMPLLYIHSTDVLTLAKPHLWMKKSPASLQNEGNKNNALSPAPKCCLFSHFPLKAQIVNKFYANRS